MSIDVTERKQVEEARELLAGEMSHRVKNLFAVASALTSIAARSAATTEGMARDLTQRLTALGHAHDLVRPASGSQDGSAVLLAECGHGCPPDRNHGYAIVYASRVFSALTHAYVRAIAYNQTQDGRSYA